VRKGGECVQRTTGGVQPQGAPTTRHVQASASASPPAPSPSMRPPPRRPIVTPEELATMQGEGGAHAPSPTPAAAPHLRAPSVLQTASSPQVLRGEQLPRSPSTPRHSSELRHDAPYADTPRSSSPKGGRTRVKAQEAAAGAKWGKEGAALTSLSACENLLNDKGVATGELLAALPQVSGVAATSEMGISGVGVQGEMGISGGGVKGEMGMSEGGVKGEMRISGVWAPHPSACSLAWQPSPSIRWCVGTHAFVTCTRTNCSWCRPLPRPCGRLKARQPTPCIAPASAMYLAAKAASTLGRRRTTWRGGGGRRGLGARRCSSCS